MQRGRPVLEQRLHLRDQQVALGEESADLQLVRAGAFAQDAAGQVDGGQGEVGQESGGDVDFPPLRLHFHDPAHDQVADFRRVPCPEGPDGEELVGFLNGARDGGDDGRGCGEDVGAVASVVGEWVVSEESGDGDEWVGSWYLIHWGSSVTVSPGVTMPLPSVLARLLGRRSCIMSTSPSASESKPPSEDDSLSYSAAAGAGGRIVIAIG